MRIAPMSAHLAAIAATALAACNSTPGVPLRVQRTAFEDRPEMVLIEGDAVCAVFDPRTCELVAVWRGNMDRRGKVHDFSQETSRPRIADPGAVLLDRLDDSTIADTIVLDAARPDFEATIDLAGTSDAWIWFEETGRTPARFELTSADGTRSWFESACHITSETDWQWNLKRLPRGGGEGRLRVTCATHPKSIRNLRLLREGVAWTNTAGAPCPVRWRGYTLLASGAVDLRFDLSGDSGDAAPIVQRLSPRSDGGIDSAFVGAPPSWARLHGGAAASIRLQGEARTP